MAAERGFYKRWYGLESEIGTVYGLIRESDRYYCTDSLKNYIYFDGVWELLSGGD